MYYKNFAEMYKLKSFYNDKNCCEREYNKNKCYKVNQPTASYDNFDKTYEQKFHYYLL